MSLAPAALAAARRALESRYGLALEGLSDGQISAAVAAALGPGASPPGSFDAALLARVIDALPIDESWLFRDDELWTWLEDEIAPGLLERALARGRPLRVLSLGCSGGQEAFSAAILLQGLLERSGIPGSSAPAWIQVQGLDPSPSRVALARLGTVGAWSVQRCRPGRLRGRVALEDAASGRHRIDDAVRAMCRFDVGNALEVAAGGSGALAGYDLVLCRHVLIYFRPEQAARLVAGLGRALEPGAILVLAAAESHLLGRAPALEPLGFLGAARARLDPGPGLRPERGGAGRPPRARRAERMLRPSTPGGRSPGPSPGRGERAPGRPAARHLERALGHVVAGRRADALRELRAACFLDPRHLLSRMILGRELISVDAARGREVLREVLHHAEQLSPDAEIPSAPGLSAGQVAAAVRLLLGEPGGA